MYDFKQVEAEISEFWKKKQVIDKLRKKLKSKKKFYFLDGPPYTSGRIHMGTAWNQVLKDEILRYKRMRGFNVWDRGGYDMHGLPTAHKIQAKHNLKDKKEIEDFGVDKFVTECKNFSVQMMEQMNKDFDKLAVSLDHVNPYMPIKNEYIEGEWWLIKKAHENKRLYPGKKVMTWCSNCETALAKHELEYKNRTDDSVFLKFKANDGRYLVIWTTTPWTIAFNLAIMVNPDVKYVEIKVDDEVWIIAKDLVEPLMKLINKKYKIIEEFNGRKLKGLAYKHPLENEFNYEGLKKKYKNAHTVILSKEYVNTESGSGLVHCAPGCGPEDYEVGKEYGLDAFNTLNEKGFFQELFVGLRAKRDDNKFIDIFDRKGILIARNPVEHEYATCWRCKDPVIFRTTNQWFFKVEDLIPKMLKQSEQIQYVPKEIKDRYQLWLKNLKDNSVTRQRYWGAPFPVWKCKSCGDYIVIGSIAELKKLAGKLPTDLHKPWIDKVKIKCKCGNQKERIPDIIDVWVDSGTASWNCLYYPRKKDFMKKFWPADLVLEGTEHTRLWFYMLQLCSNVAMGKNCFKAMYTHGMLRDIKGLKMSKSLGNIISPDEVTKKHGVDTMRLYTITMKSGEDMSFSWEEIKLKYRELDVLLNLTNYLVNYGKKISKPTKLRIEDKWILSRLNSTIKQCTELLDNYQLDKAPKLIEELFLDLSRKYVRYTRDRTEDQIVFQIIFEVLINILKMFSITCPYISEHLYLKLKEKYKLKEESIQFYSWPKVDLKKIDNKLEKEFDVVLQIIEKGLAERDKIQIGLKWPLANAEIATTNTFKKEFNMIIEKQLNVKKIILKKSKENSVKLDTKLTPELEAEGYAREMSRQVQSFRKKLGLEKKDMIELFIIVDGELEKILEKQKDFLKKRTNSKKLEIVTTEKERFKNKADFEIKNKRGQIAIIC